MSNRFNYRCPQCGSQDEITICAFVSVHLTGEGVEIVEDIKHIGPDNWSCKNGAGCGACGFEGMAEDFEPTAKIIPLKIRHGGS